MSFIYFIYIVLFNLFLVRLQQPRVFEVFAPNPPPATSSPSPAFVRPPDCDWPAPRRDGFNNCFISASVATVNKCAVSKHSCIKRRRFDAQTF
jgi:hypothetical protein